MAALSHPIRSSRTARPRALVAALLCAICLALGACGGASSSGLEDGSYTIDVALEGGTGRAQIASPASIEVEGGTATLTIVWSSSNYDLMVVDGVEYTPSTTEGGSTFGIKLPGMVDSLDVKAETTAMGNPHLIEYTIDLNVESLEAADGSNAALTAETDGSSASAVGANVDDFHNTDLGCGLEPISSTELRYATNFTIDTYEGGLKLICIANGERFLVVPEGATAPEGLADDIALIQQPLDNVYLVSSSIACLIDELDAIDSVATTSIKQDNCPVAGLAAAYETGEVRYGGSYDAPDFELIADTGCTLAIENTMINHNPNAKQKLQDLGITVLTEQSSRESEALGRLEWIKLFGALFNKEAEADAFFAQAAQRVEDVAANEPTGKTVAFFYINSNGAAVTRRSGDYVAQMIELAGGTYLFSDLMGEDDTSSSTVTLEMEEFFATARDVDVIIYNSTIDASVSSLSELFSKNQLLKQFSAVQTGNVWTTDQNMYQQMTNTADIITDIHNVLIGKTDDLTYLKQLR
ncbi:ABC transporter substrate-binding protein [Collinsella tanakaei]|uniref:ABC transporter substrate-binding protein n=1 Tax=Collinsella tanakaei TaxID=626935 RepID=UPI0025A37768|nr:ABC transporter substrate-binding protein [Collinsella tanakaei]MDM8245746.1 ABC transporter substrate-binding protein [Collinsella tanakaei]